MILILGASGFLGNYLFNRLKESNIDVVGTYFKNKKLGLIKFDLENMNLDDLNLKIKPSHVIISAAANPKPELSKSLKDSYDANVPKTKNLLDYCFKNNIIPIYISTDNVFDGENGNYNETDKTNPLNNYGKMKCEIEFYLFNSNKPFLLLRFGKVFKTELNEPTLFTNMKPGDEFKLATDQVFTPLYIEDLFEFIRDAIKNKYQGVFHLASCPPTTRYEIAQTTKNFFNIKNIKINPCSIDSLGLLEKRPKLIDLDVTKYRKLTGKKQKEIIDFLRMIK